MQFILAISINFIYFKLLSCGTLMIPSFRIDSINDPILSALKVKWIETFTDIHTFS